VCRANRWTIAITWYKIRILIYIIGEASVFRDALFSPFKERQSYKKEPCGDEIKIILRWGRMREYFKSAIGK
jgi:hypothetical protein